MERNLEHYQSADDESIEHIPGPGESTFDPKGHVTRAGLYFLYHLGIKSRNASAVIKHFDNCEDCSARWSDYEKQSNKLYGLDEFE